MNLPSDMLRRQAKFDRRLLTARVRRSCAFAFAGPWTRSPVDGTVSRAPLGTVTSGGILSLGGVVSDLKREKMMRWGSSFQPDGDLLFSLSVFAQNVAYTPGALTSVTDTSYGDGQVYDVVYVPPGAFVEDACGTAWLRRDPVYNKVVTVRVQDPVNSIDTVLLANMPCRLTPGASGLDPDDDLGNVSVSSLLLECPFIVAGAGTAGTGIVPWTAGNRFRLTSKRTVIVDDPSAYGLTGPVITYRVDSAGMDSGGDLHHVRHLVSLA